MTQKPIRAAIYARVSTTDQNPEAQLQELREYIVRRGFILHKEYVDYVTGDFHKRSQKKKRKDVAYQELMSAVSKRQIDCVVVWKYDRFARSLPVLLESLEQFNKLGVDFISYTQNIDTTTAMGRLFYTIVGAFSEFEREMIVERVKAGLANAKAKGVKLGRPERDPSSAERIIALKQEGWSLRQIAKKEGLSGPGVLKILRRNQGTLQQEIVSSTSSMTPHTALPIYQCKFAIAEVTPPIWRRVLIKGDMTLTQLSDAICHSFGWNGYSNHVYAEWDGFGENAVKIPPTVESSECYSNFEHGPNDRMLYVYGSDSEWTVEITFEKKLPIDEKLQYPYCLEGGLAGPPEKSGGAAAYQRAYYYLSRQATKENKSIKGKLSRLERDWYRDNYRFFDPDLFDRDETNKKLMQRKIKRFSCDE